MSPTSPLSLAIIGGGPTASSFLERLSANASELLQGRPLVVHLIDPHPAGTGRIWRGDQTRLLWMNSMAEDVTMFTDRSVTCEGPLRPGPTLIEWANEVAGRFDDPELDHEIHTLTGQTFPTRTVQAAYLDWFFRRTVQDLPTGVEVIVHEATAVDLTEDAEGRQLVHLDAVRSAAETVLPVDVVVMALGHIDNRAEPDQSYADFVSRHGLFHLGPANSADTDLSGIAAGSSVILRGFGLAFIDLVVLLTEGRGGRYEETPHGLRYVPSGREPVLHVGSRRGVPYRAKIGYRLQGGPLQLPKYLATPVIQELVAEHEHLDFRSDIWPLLGKEVAWGYYQELFSAHPERTSLPWDRFVERFEAATYGSETFSALIIEAVPDPIDRFDVERLDHPLRGLHFESDEALQEHLRQHLEDDLARRGDPSFSADLGAFMALLVGFGQMSRILASGKVRARSKVDDIDGWFFGFFSYFASGPPPARIRQLLALSRAGLLHFLGADMWVAADDTTGTFKAGGSSAPFEVEAVGLIEARNPKANVALTADRLVRALHERGELAEDVLLDAVDGSELRTGKIKVSADGLRLVGSDGVAHPRRHALGAPTSRPAAGAFSRPRTNAAAFRQNDAVARIVLHELLSVDPERPEVEHDAVTVRETTVAEEIAAR